MNKEKVAAQSSFLLRIFNLSFAAFGLLPLLVLLYVFYHFENPEVVFKQQLKWLILILSLTSALLFIGVRNVLAKIVLLTENLKKALFHKMDKNIVLDLAKEQGEVAELAKSFGEIMNRLEDNISELEKTKRKLHDVLSKVGKALTSSENFDMLIKLILETAIEALSSCRGVVFSLLDDGQVLVNASVGLDDFNESQLMASLGDYVQSIVNGRQMIHVSKLTESDHRYNVFSPPLICTPLVSKDKVWGGVVVSGKAAEENFNDDELKIISNLSYQIAIAFENSHLSKDREKTYFETMAALALAVEARDPYSRGHSERVGIYAAAIAEQMNLSRKDLKTISDAARLHDIGKIGIGDSILKKPGALSVEERDIMKNHPTIGEGIVMPLKNFNHLLDLIRHHHEMMDGSGYPDGLRGEEISFLTRIITVADIFDALTSDRPYRSAMKVDEVQSLFGRMCEEGKLDKKIVDVLFTELDPGKLIEENR